MRIAVDARHLGGGRGIARYLESMLTELARLPGGTEWVAVVPAGSGRRLPEGITAVRAPLGGRMANASAAATGRPRLDRIAGGADAVWIPAPAPVAWTPDIPAVLTVHDISWEERPQDFTSYERLWHTAARPRRLAARASAVVCVSEATRDAILAAGWPVKPGRTRVIREAPMLDAGPRTEPARGRYLLFVGALEPRKGIDLLADAMRRARSHGLMLPLVVVGEGRDRHLLERVGNVRFQSPADDQVLAALYAGATALVLPSRLEGFGLPPVEAAAFGVPTVATDLPVLRENLKEGFIPVPVNDPEALGQALFSVSTDSALRDRIGTEAQAAASRLSWARSAELLHQMLLESVSKERP